MTELEENTPTITTLTKLDKEVDVYLSIISDNKVIHFEIIGDRYLAKHLQYLSTMEFPLQKNKLMDPRGLDTYTLEDKKYFSWLASFFIAKMDISSIVALNSNIDEEDKVRTLTINFIVTQ